MKKIIIMGAAGRDFHNFNVLFRNNPKYKVLAFTAEQIPGISGRVYPKELAGTLYPQGIPIYPEEKIPDLVKHLHPDAFILSYSDLSHQEVMRKASRILSLGADFLLVSPQKTMLKSQKPVISICGVRTGCGKSPVTRRISKLLKSMGFNPVIIRHPMPYGDLKSQAFQRFSSIQDLKNCTIEEIEDYEHHIRNGFKVFAGIDYERILKAAEKEGDIVLWDGGNNDLPFIKPDLHFVVVDPHRPGHELRYYPGFINLLVADVIIINKINTASQKNVQIVERNVKKFNPKATIIKTNSKITVSDPSLIKNKRVLVVEDGPTITHGGMPYGAGYIVAKKYKAKIIDPRRYAVGSIKAAYRKYPHIGKVLPALGYSPRQILELEKTINQADCETVIAGTPILLSDHLSINKPIARVTYGVQETQKPGIKEILQEFIAKMNI